MAIRELVVQMDINDVRDKQKAMMKAAYTGVSSVPGVNYVGVDIQEWTITVRGETFDADRVVSIIKKNWKAGTEANVKQTNPRGSVSGQANNPQARVLREPNIPDASVLREASYPSDCVIL